MWEEPRVESFQCQFHLLTCTQINKNWYKRVSFLKITSSFSFSPPSYSRASNLGKIYANFWGNCDAIVSLDHRAAFGDQITMKLRGNRLWAKNYIKAQKGLVTG